MRIPIARQAWPFLLPLLALILLCAWWRPWFALLPAALFLFTAWFFRDPERVISARPEEVLAPADGAVIRTEGGRVSIFMNVFNVHICRTPVAGTVRSVDHHRGRFLAAFKDAASEHNERTRLVVDGAPDPIVFTLVAGLVARRIITWVELGQLLQAGQRVGLIRFGSRVDVDLPASAAIVVEVGDRVTAGRTVIARLSSATGPPPSAAV